MVFIVKHLYQLQSLLNSYTLQERRHYLPGTNRREDDASHSLSVAVICWHYYYRLALHHLSEAKILKYALIHDLVEVYAGDVITYRSDAAQAQKDIDESKALDRLTKELATEKDLALHLRRYQEMADEEARFVWTCDKLQAYTQGGLDNWRAYREGGITKKMFVDKLHEQQAKVPQVMQPEFRRLADTWIATYPDIG